MDRINYVISISNRAKKDYYSIQKYTLKNYGREQLLKYSKSIKEAFTKITENPHIGHYRPDIPKNYKSYQIGKHIIVYRIEEQTIYVVTILHSNMNFNTLFGI